jgi:DNA invertase Pin-like site-specific DNA recombinase
MSAEELKKIGNKWHKAREKERALVIELYAAIVAAVNAGMTEVEAAKVAGVDRMTIRRALGKR